MCEGVDLAGGRSLLPTPAPHAANQPEASASNTQAKPEYGGLVVLFGEHHVITFSTRRFLCVNAASRPQGN